MGHIFVSGDQETTGFSILKAIALSIAVPVIYFVCTFVTNALGIYWANEIPLVAFFSLLLIWKSAPMTAAIRALPISQAVVVPAILYYLSEWVFSWLIRAGFPQILPLHYFAFLCAYFPLVYKGMLRLPRLKIAVPLCLLFWFIGQVVNAMELQNSQALMGAIQGGQSTTKTIDAGIFTHGVVLWTAILGVLTLARFPMVKEDDTDAIENSSQDEAA